MSKPKNTLRTYRRWGNWDEEHLFWKQHKIMETFFSSQMLINATLRLVLCVYKFAFKNVFSYRYTYTVMYKHNKRKGSNWLQL